MGVCDRARFSTRSGNYLLHFFQGIGANLLVRKAPFADKGESQIQTHCYAFYYYT